MAETHPGLAKKIPPRLTAALGRLESLPGGELRGAAGAAREPDARRRRSGSCSCSASCCARLSVWLVERASGGRSCGSGSRSPCSACCSRSWPASAATCSGCSRVARENSPALAGAGRRVPRRAHGVGHGARVRAGSCWRPPPRRCSSACRSGAWAERRVALADRAAAAHAPAARARAAAASPSARRCCSGRSPSLTVVGLARRAGGRVRRAARGVRRRAPPAAADRAAARASARPHARRAAPRRARPRRRRSPSLLLAATAWLVLALGRDRRRRRRRSRPATAPRRSATGTLDQVVFPTSHNSMGGADVPGLDVPQPERRHRAAARGRHPRLPDRRALRRAGRRQGEDRARRTRRPRWPSTRRRSARRAWTRCCASATGWRPSKQGERDVYMCHGFCELGRAEAGARAARRARLPGREPGRGADHRDPGRERDARRTSSAASTRAG